MVGVVYICLYDDIFIFRAKSIFLIIKLVNCLTINLVSFKVFYSIIIIENIFQVE